MIKKINILYAENDELIRLTYSKILEKFGFDVCAVCNGDQAWQFYQRRNGDLLIFDMHISGKNGRELIRLIRKKDKQTPILIISDLNCCDVLYEGANDFISKNAPNEEHKSRIDKAIGRAYIEEKYNECIYKLTPYIIFNAHTMTIDINGEKSILKSKIGNLLWIFCKKMNERISSRDICIQLWNIHNELKENELRSYISKLRKYFRKNTDVKIKNMYGGEYVLIVSNCNLS